MVGWAFGLRLADTPIWLAERFSDCWFKRPDARPAWYCNCRKNRNEKGRKMTFGKRRTKAVKLSTLLIYHPPSPATLEHFKSPQIQPLTLCLEERICEGTRQTGKETWSRLLGAASHNDENLGAI